MGFTAKCVSGKPPPFFVWYDLCPIDRSTSHTHFRTLSPILPLLLKITPVLFSSGAGFIFNYGPRESGRATVAAVDRTAEEFAAALKSTFAAAGLVGGWGGGILGRSKICIKTSDAKPHKSDFVFFVDAFPPFAFLCFARITNTFPNLDETFFLLSSFTNFLHKSYLQVTRPLRPISIPNDLLGAIRC